MHAATMGALAPIARLKEHFSPPDPYRPAPPLVAEPEPVIEPVLTDVPTGGGRIARLPGESDKDFAIRMCKWANQVSAERGAPPMDCSWEAIQQRMQVRHTTPTVVPVPGVEHPLDILTTEPIRRPFPWLWVGVAGAVAVGLWAWSRRGR